MSTFDEAAAALDDRDWSGAQIDDRPRSATVVQSVRFSRELTERLLAEAARRGVTPNEAIRNLVEAGLSEVDESASKPRGCAPRVIDAPVRRLA
ncbi:MAG TPA: hypothetical protein VFM55_21740 [Micromonosporaceae bacterium]|nr:hypothetical protein [Micromonosporaceae bacterium]